MSNPFISVFYRADSDRFFLSKIDFSTLDMAEKFLDSRLFRIDGYVFLFMLRKGNTLLRGNPIENSVKHFEASMKFAIDIPVEFYNFDEN